MYEKTARYVSNFPSELDFPEIDTSLITDIWFNNQQALDVGLFDMKSHAMLLCNFFNYLDCSNQIEAISHIVFGKSILEGYAA
jgi:coiled-coil and C2 domain-containing protein 2A